MTWASITTFATEWFFSRTRDFWLVLGLCLCCFFAGCHTGCSAARHRHPRLPDIIQSEEPPLAK